MATPKRALIYFDCSAAGSVSQTCHDLALDLFAREFEVVRAGPQGGFAPAQPESATAIKAQGLDQSAGL
jgi:uncharacterized metal-binding protein